MPTLENASTTSRDGSESATSEEPPGVAGMESTFPHHLKPHDPNAREGWPRSTALQKSGLANLIEVLSISIETSQTVLQGAISKGLTDPTNPIIQMESAALERNNASHQCAVSEYTSLPPVASPTVRDIT
ncbi:hypothetical protein TNCV_4164381 [Trichonephila clavipes]|nr:hypothetical protein TNCV_4164381 [Trichonephila clavipes]